ncbi:hypothetical protein AAIA72_15155 [Hahella sp. SMD15-11]|uniref:Uncharacterized protein n=1 Tax=Thermohahella caldifontis TaxID=3142973 RepID=A0AB39UVR3_9GAMM
MSTRDTEDDQSLSEEQRIQMLERSMSLNRIILLFLAILAVVSLSVSITWLMLSATSEDPTPQIREELAQLKQENARLREDIEALRGQLPALTEELPKLRALVTNSSTPALQQILLDQEKSIQSFLKALKTGMYDLARMIPGSRTWLDIYGQQMDEALRESLDRMRRLQRLKNGEEALQLN